MKSLDMEPGFQAPCRKAHLSLLYGNLVEDAKEEARTIVRRDFEKGIFDSNTPGFVGLMVHQQSTRVISTHADVFTSPILDL